MSRRLILLVDPDDDSREILRLPLERRGYEVAEARDGAEALYQVRTLRPDLVIGEHPVRLPDGSVLCETLRRDPATAGVPFLAITSYAVPEELERARRTHSAGVLVKPVSPARVVEAVWELVGSPFRSAPLPAPALILSV